ncbi:hypothetical protein DICPUDRAFT_156747 [Dictyostelium purpureum]|uniref:Carbohydrate kinase PfkB domain-containing protein n=1 Tax=Dictyostelium purpureum TaxID=5786 RepID=F0ZXC0_DICPU|nr:uncharacterized protein DICPUDRAFT_156747 [Dictyostelium purpureum]EGC31394.1 hypothetical protein DICPUDRAFT_156747 [Dictyostelium purpureum]|eukprot:XP_003292064.1 hypothetical protein DICPUDRAFT_156747 [Dictyostelium purpureum]
MDHEIDSVIKELVNSGDGVLENLKEMSLVYQSSSDWFGNKNGDKQVFLTTMKEWLQSNIGANKYFLLILTDSKNGFGVGGTLRNYKTGESTYIEPYWFDPVQIPSDKIVDSTGAGDAFRAGLIYSLIYKNQALNNSLQFASGGLNCLSYGGNSGTPTFKEILELINSKQ